MHPVALIALTALLVYLSQKLIKALQDHYRMRKLANELPGPKGVPILGNMLDTMSMDLFELTKWMTENAEKTRASGETMMAFNFLGSTFCAPLDGKTAKDILDSNELIEKGNGYDFFSAWLGDGLVMSNGEKWHGRRKLLTPTFHFQQLNGYVQTFNAEIKTMTEIFAKEFDGKVFDIYPYLKRCALDIICETAMGRSIGAQRNPNHPYVIATKNFVEIATEHALNPLNWCAPYWHLSGKAKTTKESLKIMLDFTINIIKERQELRARGIKSIGKTTNFLDLLLDMNDSGNLSYEDIREEVDTFMFTGHDTTSTGVAWAMWCLSHHLDVQEKLREEIDDVVGDDEVTLDHLKDMKYLDAVLREVFRLYPPVPDVNRKVSRDFMCGKYLVPRGATIDIMQLILHRNKQIIFWAWGEDADKFNPLRFVNDDLSKRHAFDYVPFSAGPRNCIGQKFAQYEAKIMIIWLVRRFRITSTIPMVDNSVGMVTVLAPKLGVPVQLDLI